MRIFGIILVVAGILMMVFNSISYQTEKNVANIGPVEINKKENKHIGWPMYAGGVVTIAGVLIFISGMKKR